VVEGLQLIFVFLVLPAGLAWTARRYVSINKAFAGSLIIIISAGVPALWVFYETQQADGITRAASVVVTPFLFLLMLIPAGVGYALARPKARS
jgi:hypothetical protein